ncbi:pimeloyl-ACP methyl ester esterase BioH [Methylococcus capsulatus]|uniref:pimeloyl-ACP methyl ester esterase BioH n=1 Tax=Methylococcus capsulatus TaxID=414 RepID=UPI001C531CE6|nr:pimeloyl-ACP methyl ester esterase BioH [Methylococcus capsulatus]QXP90503.1 pimeloyl-ACP methyl ester esterase BioH [Methylococcus capsulatus]
MGLFVETSGRGSEVVLIHGWGMHGGIWSGFVPWLTDSYRVTRIDLPGHGHSPMLADWSLETVAAAVLEVVPQPAHWVGWSLGAMVALEAARTAPEAVASLTLLCGTPRFVAEPGWPGMEAATLTRFADGFLSDYEDACRRFLALQAWGMPNERDLLRSVRSHLAVRPPPERTALLAGLEVLRHADLRGVLRGLSQPVQALLGRRDRLVPVELGDALARLKTGLVSHRIDDAPHVPFLTHGERTARLIHEFIASS